MRSQRTPGPHRTTAAVPSFGILPFILTSVYGTAGAILFGVPVGFFTAVYLAKLAPAKVKSVVESAVSLLAVRRNRPSRWLPPW